VTDDPQDDDQHGNNDHVHEGETLGRVDVTAWGAGIAGVLLGLAVGIAFALATAPIG
jgi:hypothetical protein